MKVVIIGAGIAGAVAAGALSSYQPEVYDGAKDEQQSRKHKAVMRLRDASISRYLGVGTTKIQVYKAIAVEGSIQLASDARLNNMYSLKTYGMLGARSLGSTGLVDRFIMDDDFSIKGVHYDSWLMGIEGGKLSFAGVGAHGVEYDVCISTIPMPVMLKACGLSSRLSFEHLPVFVYRGMLTVPSTVHQTLYFPSDNTPIYRATIQNEGVIIESMSSLAPVDISSVMRCFGLRQHHYTMDAMPHKQEMGKMLPVDDTMRKRHILELTEKFGIYSLGRFAIWKSIRADHLVQDIELIKAMIKDSSGYTTKKVLGG